MSATVDVNVLVYASAADESRGPAASALLSRLSEGPEIVTLFWLTLSGYVRIATHPSISAEPLSLEEAFGNVQSLLALPHVRALGEGVRFWTSLRESTSEVLAVGNLVPDAHIVALMREHGVKTIWSHDRDFRKFDGIDVRDPFASD